MPTFEEDAGCIYTCQGPPRCDLTSADSNVEERKRNCPFCTVEKADINGIWHVIRGPSEC